MLTFTYVTCAKKIDTGFNKKLLHTIRGAGYVLREEN